MTSSKNRLVPSRKRWSNIKFASAVLAFLAISTVTMGSILFAGIMMIREYLPDSLYLQSLATLGLLGSIIVIYLVMYYLSTVLLFYLGIYKYEKGKKK